MPKLPITHTVAVYQFERAGNTEAYAPAPKYTNINACITPTGTDIQISGDVPAFQVFEIFIYDITLTLTNGDKIVDQNGTAYLIQGVPYVINNRFLQYFRVLGRQIV